MYKMKNLVKTTVIGLGLVVAMSSCTKDDLERVKLSGENQEIPIKKSPSKETSLDDELPIPTESLPDIKPVPKEKSSPKKVRIGKEFPSPTELIPADEFQGRPLSSNKSDFNELSEAKPKKEVAEKKIKASVQKMRLKRVSDMAIIRENRNDFKLLYKTND